MTQLSSIIQNYIVKKYFKNFVVIATVLTLFILLIDYIEGSRRFSGADLSFHEILFLSVLKLPEIISQLFFFLVFLSGVVTFNQMQNNSELVVIQASGGGFLLLLRRLFALVFILGILQILVLDPFAKMCRELYVDYSSQHLGHSHGVGINSKFPPLGVWLTQKRNDSTEYLVGIKNYGSRQDGFKNVSLVCIHCKEVEQGTLINASRAVLMRGKWSLFDVVIKTLEGEIIKLDRFEIETNLTRHLIISRLETESLINGQIFNIWTLPDLINTVEKSGLSAQYLYAYLFQMIFHPIYLVILLLLAMALNLTLPRQLRNMKIYAQAIAIMFVIFFFKNLLLGMTLAENISIYLGVVNPVILILCFTIYQFLKREQER